MSRFPGAKAQGPGRRVVEGGLVLMRLRCSRGCAFATVERGGCSVGRGGNWLKCRSISFSWFFAIYEPKTCDDEISGMWEWDDGEFWVEDSVVMMVDGVEEC